MVLVNGDIVARIRAGEDISGAEGRVLVQELLRQKITAARNGVNPAIEGSVAVAVERVQTSDPVANADAKEVLDALEELDAAISEVR